MLGSVATLFDTGDARRLKPALHLVYNMGNDAEIVAAATACNFTRDPSLTTDSLPSAQSIPRFNNTWLLIDAIHSDVAPAGTLCVIQVMLQAMRAGLKGVVAVAVTSQGKRLFDALGFETHNFRKDGMPISLCWAECESLDTETLARRMRIPMKMLESSCFRMGLTPKSSERLIGRCKQ